MISFQKNTVSKIPTEGGGGWVDPMLVHGLIKHYVNNFNISETFKDVSNTLQNFTLMGATVFEIVGGPAVGTKMLGK